MPSNNKKGDRSLVGFRTASLGQSVLQLLAISPQSEDGGCLVLAQVAQIKEVVLVDEQISRINLQINVVDGKIPVKLFGLLNDFLSYSEYVSVEPVLSEKRVDLSRVKVDEALCRLEQMEA